MHADPSSESRSGSFYVPRDEAFAEVKQVQFTTTTASSGLTALLQFLDTIVLDQNLGFANFSDIDALYKQGFNLPPLNDNTLGLLRSVVPKLIKAVSDTQQALRFDPPETVSSKCCYVRFYLIFSGGPNCGLKKKNQ